MRSSSACFWSVMWFIDRLFLTWYSREATHAALPCGMYHWTMICLPVGIASYVNTFVAQYYGAGQRRRIGNAVQQAIWFGWLCVPLMLISIPLAPWLFAGTSGNASIVRQEVIYFQVLALGAGAAYLAMRPAPVATVGGTPPGATPAASGGALRAPEGSAPTVARPEVSVTLAPEAIQRAGIVVAPCRPAARGATPRRPGVVATGRHRCQTRGVPTGGAGREHCEA